MAVAVSDSKPRLRGQLREQLRVELARRFLAERPHIAIAALADRYQRIPSVVRRLLEEPGIRSQHHLLGLTDDEVAAALVNRYKAGASVDDLAEVTGIDRPQIRRHVRAAREGRQLRRLKMPIADVIALYRSGTSIRELAPQAGTSYGTLRTALLDAGVELRRRGGSRAQRTGVTRP